MREDRARRRRTGTAALLAVLCGLTTASPARAAGPPSLGVAWASNVVATSATLHSTVTPDSVPGPPNLPTSYRFDYLTEAAYEANLAMGPEGFAGAARAPAGAEAPLGFNSTPIKVSQLLTGLSAETAYRYRIVAHNSAGTVASPALTFVTQGFGGGALLPDGRGWEMVSPVDKNGGQVDPPGTLLGGGVIQAAAAGDSVTYSSAAAFGDGAQGAPTGSQYLASRGPGGWATENITTPQLSGSYGIAPEGVPYQLFSPDLARALLLNGEHCRGEGESCPVANPPLAGSGASAGYQNYYLRDNAAGGFQALLTGAELLSTPLSAAQLDLRLAGAAPDLRHVVLSTCAALSAAATEVPLGGGCDPAKPNLYEWSSGTGLSLVNLLPGHIQGTPGAALAAQSGAVSEDGSRVYWTDLATGDLYLREGGQTKLVGEGSFQTAAADGSSAFYTAAGHLHRYAAAGPGSSTDLTPSGGVQGVLGASADGDHVYYLSAAGLFLWHAGTTTAVAPAADPGNYPPTTGSARVSADGTRLAFVSTAPLTGYDNADASSGEPDSQVYLYDAAANGGGGALACVSCNPTNERPIGPSTIPGANANGEGPEATHSYKPRALTANGIRLFLDSADALVLADTNDAPDVYQWEAQGTGSCARVGGCLALISSGKAEDGASFLDASADGSDAFFLTGRSLVGADPGSLDLYDAREGGGFPEPVEPIPCEGDACQVLPPEPVDPPLNTLITGRGNPPVRYSKPRRHKRGHAKRHRRSGVARQRGGRR
jgi:hypothetical protein